MIDIDFRYVMRQDSRLTAQMANPPMVRVLQWRKKVRQQLTANYYSEQQITAVVWPPVQYGEPEWTDWQDVRTEEE